MLKLPYEIDVIVIIPILQVRKLRHMDSVNKQVLRACIRQTLS